jgi:hypothetical protein
MNLPGKTFLRRRLFGFVAALIAVAGLFVAGLATGATAAVVVAGPDGDLGTLSIGTTGSFSHITTDNAQFSAPLPGGGEVIMFQLSTDANIAAAAVNINLQNILGISNFGFKLVQAGSGSDFTTFTDLATGVLSDGALSLSLSGLMSGVFYGFLFFGEITGSSGGFYAGNFTVSAVPLPPAVWLFLSALIGLAGVVRRKSTRTGAASPKGARHPA